MREASQWYAHLTPKERENVKIHPVLAKRVAQNTTRLREKHKLTQHALADRLGVSQAYVSQIENGERSSPSLEVIEKLAAVFGVQPVQMFKE